MSSTPRSVSPAAWDFYEYVYGPGTHAKVWFDLEAAREEIHLGDPFCYRVLLFPEESALDQVGMPAPDELIRLEALEARLTDRLEQAVVRCRQVGRLTYAGMHEWVFQVTDKQAFEQMIHEFLDEHAGEYKTQELPGWDFFDDRIRPDHIFWQQISDRRQLEALWEKGYTEKDSLQLAHHFSGQTAILGMMENALKEDHFKRISLVGEELIMAKVMPLQPREIFQLTYAMHHFSEDAGVKYEGWEALKPATQS